ncbi:MAG: hypothetical protein HOP13_07460 [Alphaproteobacteria bacterium]|nr:hypothetical protein [Alphaproteobacteria bacterium]
MTNPFLRRATEYIRDDSAFLAIVSPEPLRTFVARHPKRDALFDMPVRVIGTPGSGKTMMATLIEFRLVEAILRDQASESNRVLASALAAAGLVDDGKPVVAAVRLPMESEYRDFWELPYDVGVRTKLVLSLIQARAVLGLIRNLTANKRRNVDGIQFVARDDADAQLVQVGGSSALSVRQRAREVERAIYSVGAGLLPPPVEAIPEAARDPYQPLEVIREVLINWEGAPLSLKPLIILDDAHTLHPDQFEALFRALTKREIRIGRWMMMRMDALSPSTVFQSSEDEALPGLKRDRDYLDIVMQTQGQRSGDRRQFRRMATDMADKYLKLVPSLRERNYTQFSSLLSSEPPRLSDGQLQELRRSLDSEQRRLKISPQRRRAVEELVEEYVKGAKSRDIETDVQLAMTRILLNRYAVRVANMTPALFETEDLEPKTPLKADAGVADGARLFLHQKHGRPLHYGLDDLCDASNENAELFLQLAGGLVARMETRAIRNQDPALAPPLQQQALNAKAVEIIDAWSFPFARKVRALTDRLALQCKQISMQPNAPLGAGANAFGVLEQEMAGLLNGENELALVLKYAVAYGAISAVRDYGQGGKNWCLLELTGPVCLRHGLTLKRGGFVESRVDELSAMIEGDGAL